MTNKTEVYPVYETKTQALIQIKNMFYERKKTIIGMWRFVKKKVHSQRKYNED